jgi:hypothetical protein
MPCPILRQLKTIEERTYAHAHIYSFEAKIPAMFHHLYSHAKAADQRHIHRVAASRPLDLFCVCDYTLISGYSAPLLHKNIKDMLFYVRAYLCLYIQPCSLSIIASRLNSMGFDVNFFVVPQGAAK